MLNLDNVMNKDARKGENSVATITIPITEDRLLRLRELAREANVAPEDLVRASLEEWLKHPKDDFARAANYVIEKNIELYRRLA
jgi:hypothetical protein